MHGQPPQQQMMMGEPMQPQQIMGAPPPVPFAAPAAASNPFVMIFAIRLTRVHEYEISHQ